MTSFKEYLNNKQNFEIQSIDEGLLDWAKSVFSGKKSNKSGSDSSTASNNSKNNLGFFSFFMSGLGFGSSRLDSARAQMLQDNEKKAKDRAQELRTKLEDTQIAKMKAKNSIKEAQRAAKHNARKKELESLAKQYADQEKYYNNFGKKHPTYIISDSEIERIHQSMDAMMSGLESGHRSDMEMYRDDLLVCLVDENGNPRPLNKDENDPNNTSVAEMIEKNPKLKEAIKALSKIGEQEILDGDKIKPEFANFLDKEIKTIAETNSKLKEAQKNQEDLEKEQSNLEEAKTAISNHKTKLGEYYDSEVSRAEQLINRGKDEDIESLKELYENADDKLKEKLKEKFPNIDPEKPEDIKSENINQPIKKENVESKLNEFNTKVQTELSSLNGEERENKYKELKNKFEEDNPTLKGILKDNLGETTGSDINLKSIVKSDYISSESSELKETEIKEKQDSNIKERKDNAETPASKKNKPKLELSENAKEALETCGIDASSGSIELPLNDVEKLVEDHSSKLTAKVEENKEVLKNADKARKQIISNRERAANNQEENELQRTGIFADVERMELEPGERVDQDGNIYIIDPITKKHIEKPKSTDSDAISNYENVRKLAILTSKPESKRPYKLHDNKITYTNQAGEEKTVELSKLDSKHSDYNEIVGIIAQHKNNSKLAAAKESIIQDENKNNTDEKQTEFQKYLNSRKESDPEKFAEMEDEIGDEEFLDNINTDHDADSNADDNESDDSLKRKVDDLKTEQGKIKGDLASLKEKIDDENLSEEDKEKEIQKFKEKHKDSPFKDSISTLELNNFNDWKTEVESEMQDKIDHIIDNDDEESNEDDKISKDENGKPKPPKRKIKKVRGKRKGTFRYYVYNANGGRRKDENGKPLRSNKEDWQANMKAWSKYRARLDKWKKDHPNESLSIFLQNNLNIINENKSNKLSEYLNKTIAK